MTAKIDHRHACVESLAPACDGDSCGTVAERFKTKLCHTFAMRASCPYADRCMFAHGLTDLRTMEMNLADRLTSPDAIRQFLITKTVLNRISARQRATAASMDNATSVTAPTVNKDETSVHADRLQAREDRRKAKWRAFKLRKKAIAARDALLATLVEEDALAHEARVEALAHRAKLTTDCDVSSSSDADEDFLPGRSSLSVPDRCSIATSVTPPSGASSLGSSTTHLDQSPSAAPAAALPTPYTLVSSPTVKSPTSPNVPGRRRHDPYNWLRVPISLKADTGV